MDKNGLCNFLYLQPLRQCKNSMKSLFPVPKYGLRFSDCSCLKAREFMCPLNGKVVKPTLHFTAQFFKTHPANMCCMHSDTFYLFFAKLTAPCNTQ